MSLSFQEFRSSHRDRGSDIDEVPALVIDTVDDEVLHRLLWQQDAESEAVQTGLPSEVELVDAATNSEFKPVEVWFSSSCRPRT